jgi:hypothetical protein
MKRPKRIPFLMRERGAFDREPGKDASSPKPTAPPKLNASPRLVRPTRSGTMHR